MLDDPGAEFMVTVGSHAQPADLSKRHDSDYWERRFELRAG